VDLMAEADMTAVRAKSLQLGRVFMELMDAHCGELGFTLVSPREDAQRGSHVSYAHPEGYGIMQALKERGVIGDFRDPDVLRFGLTPLYLRHVDMLEAVLAIREVCETRAWDDPRWAVRAAVT
jgi:kynureninase